MSKCLFIGGPYARRVLEVDDNLKYLSAAELPMARPRLDNYSDPPKITEKIQETRYERGQIYDANSNRHYVFVAPDVDAIQELMRCYAQPELVKGE
jgi:hypothetical protein